MFMNIKFVGIHRALHNHFAQTPGGSDENHFLKSGFGIHGEHHPRSARTAANHALHTGRQGHAMVLIPLVNSVGNGAVVVQGCKNMTHRL